ncbi:hypothetical protein OAD36_03655 [Gammaproteobacteria bacterium]|nr:hypothetical protein [Gammaproteobacteria bacterium]
MIPKKLPKGLKEYICEGFKFIQQSDELEYKQKVDMLGNLFSLGAGTGWRPKAITLGALKLFIENDFKKPLGLERAHKFHRRDTLKTLIETEWKDDEWWDWYAERDYTTLATREENRNEANFENLITFPIPLELNLFWGARVGFEYGKAEKEFLRNLASQL